jgi:hypothetical protein
MSLNHHDTPLDDTRFDRLADGELDEAQRRELLANLDNEPNGWRRCALAFLESQCWKESFVPIARRESPVASAQQSMRNAPSRWRGRVEMLLAMAGCFLVVFLAVSHLQNRHERTGVVDQVASTPAKSPGAQTPWRMVTVASPSGEALKVPVKESDNLDPQWLRSLPSAMPNDVLQAFNRTGHQVEQHREFVPVSLQDGRKAVVPVDQVDIHYVGNGAY